MVRGGVNKNYQKQLLHGGVTVEFGGGVNKNYQKQLLHSGVTVLGGGLFLEKCQITLTPHICLKPGP